MDFITILYTNLCLYHTAPIDPHGAHEAENVNISLCFNPLQLSIQCNEGTSAAHSSTAVHDHRTGVYGVGSCHFSHKVQ